MFRSKQLQYGINLKGPLQEDSTLEKDKRKVRELGQVVNCVTDMLEIEEQKTTVSWKAKKPTCWRLRNRRPGSWPEIRTQPEIWIKTQTFCKPWINLKCCSTKWWHLREVVKKCVHYLSLCVPFALYLQFSYGVNHYSHQGRKKTGFYTFIDQGCPRSRCKLKSNWDRDTAEIQLISILKVAPQKRQCVFSEMQLQMYSVTAIINVFSDMYGGREDLNLIDHIFSQLNERKLQYYGLGRKGQSCPCCKLLHELRFSFTDW